MAYAEYLAPEQTALRWQSDEALAEIEPRMLAIEQRVLTYEVPLMRALEKEYAEKIAQRGWLVCGPASITLMRLLHEDLAIPILPNCPDQRQEHIRLGMYVINPHNEPGKPPSMDHTLVHYYTGEGFALTLDPTYALLWRRGASAPGVFTNEWHYSHWVERDLLDFYDLHEVGSLSASRNATGVAWPLLQADMPRTYHHTKGALQVMHTPAVFNDALSLPNGDILEVGAYWGERLARVLQSVRAEVAPLTPAERPPAVRLCYEQ